MSSRNGYFHAKETTVAETCFLVTEDWMLLSIRLEGRNLSQLNVKFGSCD